MRWIRAAHNAPAAWREPLRAFFRLVPCVNDHLTRRTFLADSSRATIGGTFALRLPWLVALAGCVLEERAFRHLTNVEARTLAAFAAQIIPSHDGTPGALEAGAVYFIDRAIGHPFFQEGIPVVRAGLADLDARARQRGVRRGFSALADEAQQAVLREIERTQFFNVARTLVIIGTLADPFHGGNRDGIGWSMIGMEHQPIYRAPFGWYDAHVEATPNSK
jgi:gluconate 2-dehydrogenase gamma chain